MSINIAGYTFEGPYTSTDNLEDKAGVYAILCHKGQNYLAVDVGESAKVKTRVETHDRKECWRTNCKSTLAVAVHHTPNLQQAGRRKIEKEIREQHNWPCGE